MEIIAKLVWKAISSPHLVGVKRVLSPAAADAMRWIQPNFRGLVLSLSSDPDSQSACSAMRAQSRLWARPVKPAPTATTGTHMRAAVRHVRSSALVCTAVRLFCSFNRE